MKNIALVMSLLCTSFSTAAQNPFFDQQFRGFRIFFEEMPQANLPAQISVIFPACREPYSTTFPEFPTETQIIDSEIALTYSFWIPNSPGCFSGYIERYTLPILRQGSYQLRVKARLITPASSVPAQIVETRTMAQLDFQIGEPLATQVPNLTPEALL